MIKLLVAMSQNGVIGKGNELPWRIPSELKHFAKTTANSAMLVGSKTWESMRHINLGNRVVYVITSNPNARLRSDISNNSFREQVIYTSNPLSVLEKYETSGRLYIVGGKSIYEKYGKYAKYLTITEIEEDYDGDVTLDLNELKGEYSDVVTNKYVEAEGDSPGYHICTYINHKHEEVETQTISFKEFKEMMIKLGEDPSAVSTNNLSNTLTSLTDKSYLVMHPDDSEYIFRCNWHLNREVKCNKPAVANVVKDMIRKHIKIVPRIKYSYLNPTIKVSTFVRSISRRSGVSRYSIDVSVEDMFESKEFLFIPTAIKSMSVKDITSIVKYSDSTTLLVGGMPNKLKTHFQNTVKTVKPKLKVYFLD